MRVAVSIGLLALTGCVRTYAADEPERDVGQDTSRFPGTWVNVASGVFQMGSPADEPCRAANDSDEALHPVRLSRTVEIQSTEVTQEQFLELMGYNPSFFSPCDTCPVEMVTWHEAVAYCNALSALRGLPACYSCSGSGGSLTCAPEAMGSRFYSCPGYRLPTEAEWERAYRAGTQTALYNGNTEESKCFGCSDSDLDARADSIAWYCVNSGNATHPVGLKKPNAHGLFDMAGNVWEWCHDSYQVHLGTAVVADPVNEPSSEVVARGGCWINNARALRAAHRGFFSRVYRNNGVGFRCVRSTD